VVALSGALPEVVADAVSAGLLLTTAGGDPVWFNRALRDLAGPTLGQLPLGAVVPGAPPIQAHFPDPDGIDRWLEISCQPLDGRLLYEIRDVTALRAERDAAHHGQWRLAHIERIAKVGTWEWDLATDSLIWSDTMHSMLGVTTGTLLDFDLFRSLVHPDDLAMVEKTLRRAIRAAEPFSYTLRMYLADRSSLRTFECYGEVFTDPIGRPAKLLGTAHDITEIRRAQDELAYLADHDALTGLVNRRSFTARLDALLASTRSAAARNTEARGGSAGSNGGGTANGEVISGDVPTPGPAGRARNGALLLLDVDNFKDINDLRGHAVGDQVMRGLARRLAQHLPAGAVLGRLGGDEFAAVLGGCDAAAALEAAERLCRAAGDTPMVVGGEALRVTVSVGAAPLDGEADCEVLLAHADLALYEAKNAGRNRARLFAPEQYRHAVQRVNILSRVRSALDAGHLTLVAQPIVRLADGRTSSYELLVRLRDGLYPQIGPADILPALERGDLVRELDRWVVTEAVTALSQANDLCLDVNVSTRSIDDDGFGDWVVEALDRAGVVPRRLGVEITETAAISNLDAARRLAVTLTGAGCRFSLDDFGAGFGSFAYLKHLPFTTVKIAGEFVRQADSPGADRVLVDAVVRAAKGLGMTTVAEYVDRAPLVNALRDLGVDRGQGYYLGRPGRLEDLLAKHRAEPGATQAIRWPS
jgi:diguanylate cyclase (GGDEF)-like protein/PAS domain S-box-containing protein